MSVREEFLKVTSYAEFDKRRNEFEGLDIQDVEILKHLDELFPTVDNSDYENGIITEVYKKHPK